jgi:hypothetical protein
MSAQVDRKLSDLLRDFQAVQSDDIVKSDLELTCLRCGEVVCDVEHEDTLETLVNVALNHRCGESDDRDGEVCDCGGKGWFIIDRVPADGDESDEGGLEVQRCDDCHILTDEQARELTGAQEALRQAMERESAE